MDFASLGIKIQTSEVKAGVAELDKLAGSAERAEKSIDGLGNEASNAGKEIARFNNSTRTIPPALASQAQQFMAAGISAKQYSAALRTVPAQITDIVTGLASGQNPFLVAIQQGGQLRDQFGGFGNALRALSSVLTPVRLAIGGLAAAVGIAAKGFADGQRESFEFSRSIALTGNAAGVTAGQLDEAARKIDGFAGTQSNAADVLARLAGTGKVAGDDLAEFAAAAIKLERAGGQSVEETVKQFEALGKKPRQAVLELSGSFGFLTEKTFEQVLALEKQGKTFEAGRVSQKAFADGLETVAQKLEKQRGTIQNFGRGTADVFKELGDSLLDLGRVRTLESELGKLQDRLKRAKDTPVSAEFLGDANVSKIEALIAAKQKQIDSERALAREEAERLARTAAGLAKLNAAFEGEKERRQQLIALAKAQFNADLSGLRRTLDARLDAFAGSEAELDALRSAGLIKDEEFFKRKRELIEQSTAAQVDSLRQQAARIAAEKVSGVEAIMNQQAQRDLAAEIARVTAEGARQVTALTIEQTVANKRLTDSFEDLRNSAKAYLDTINKRGERELAGLGIGNQARDRQAQLDRVKDDAEAQRRMLEMQREKLGEGKFAEGKALIDSTEMQALEALGKQFEALDAKAADFRVGAREAFANYLTDLKDVASQSREAFKSAFEGAEDAIVKFVSTGKLNFKDLANSIVQDLIRIQVRALIVQAIGGIFGGSGGGAVSSIAGRRASGGPVDAGKTYLVGERGPELIVPRAAGTVIPAKQTAMMIAAGQQRGPTIVINQTINASGGDQVAMRQIMAQAKQETIAAARSAIADDLRRGRFDGALQGAQR